MDAKTTTIKETYKFKLTLGDPSDYGHGKTKEYVISSNKPLEEVRKAYLLACKLSGIEFEDYLCSEYEDPHMDQNQVEFFKNIGIDVLPLLDEEWSEGENYAYVGIDGYIKILFCFITLYTPEIKLTIVNDGLEDFEFRDPETKRYISHFGYGLFD